MIKYLVQHKITKCFRIAFRITHISDENEYLKEKYNFLVSACDIGKFLIVDEETGIHFVLSGYAFYEGYDIVKCIVMYPAIPFAKSGDDVESEIDKRRKMLHENICNWWTRNVMNSVYGAPDLHTPVYSDTDAHFCYPYLPSGYDIHNMCGSNMVRHLDIREMNKEKDTMITKPKTINFCVKKVIFNGPATIVIWGDGTKTVVKCKDGDSYSKWAGFAMCIAKRLYGDDFHHQFRHFCGVEDDTPKKNTGDALSDNCASTSEAFGDIGKTADYRDVIFKELVTANLVLRDMRNIIHALGFVSVADCCHLVGVPNKIEDHDIGWTDIFKAMIIPVSNGYLIKYPEPASRDQSDRIEKEPDFQLRKVYHGSHVEAWNVREALTSIIATNGYATVADYYDISDVEVSPEERKKAFKYGWKNIGVANIGLCGPSMYKLDIPEPKKLNLNKPNEVKGLD